MNKPSNLEEYDLNYRIFGGLAEAKRYAKSLKLKLQRRNSVTNKSGEKFYVESLGLSNRKVQSLEEGYPLIYRVLLLGGQAKFV